MNKKKIIILIAGVITTLCLTGCSAKGDKSSGDVSKKTETSSTEEGNKEEANKEDSKGEGLSAEKNLFDVEVTLPSSFFEDSTQEEIEAAAKEAGVKKVKFNEDGSVVYSMSKSDHKKLLADTKEAIDEGIKEMVEDKETYPSFQKIEYSKDCTEFIIHCDKALYNEFESFSALGFYIYGNYFQALNAVNAEDIRTVVYFKDKDTGEVLNTGDSAEMGQ